MTAPEIACIEAEAAVLGCLLSLPLRPARDVAWRLCAEDFTDPRHRVVFDAIGDCMLADIPADPVTVLGELRRMGAETCMTADRTAGTFLADLLAAAPVPASAPHYARVVVEHAFRRRVAEAAARLEQVAGTESLDGLTDLLREERDSLRTHWERTIRFDVPPPEVAE